MIFVNIRAAKARLNQLVAAAEAGNPVAILRGAEPVAALVRIRADDLSLLPRLTDDEAAHAWRALALDADAGRVLVFETAAEAAECLDKTRLDWSGRFSAQPKSLR